jgi:hypothetical protein
VNNSNGSKQQKLFEEKKESEVKDMPNTVNLLDVATAESMEPTLDIVRLGYDERAIILFTAESKEVDLHYCGESEISGYVLCNGPDCVLCRIGRRKDKRLLLPVYLPAAGCVGILPVSRSLRPFALLPQMLNILKAEKPMVMFVIRDGAKYIVSTAELQKDIDGGEPAIKRFLDEYKAGQHDLTAAYPRIDNEQLASVEQIGRMMALKGIRRDAGNKRT